MDHIARLNADEHFDNSALGMTQAASLEVEGRRRLDYFTKRWRESGFQAQSGRDESKLKIR